MLYVETWEYKVSRETNIEGIVWWFVWNKTYFHRKKTREKLVT